MIMSSQNLNTTEQIHRGRTYVTLKRSANFNNVIDLFIDGGKPQRFAGTADLYQSFPHLKEAPYV